MIWPWRPTCSGPLEDVAVPRCHRSGLTQQIQQVFLRSTKPSEEAVERVFPAGVSTRRVGELLERVIGRLGLPGVQSRIQRCIEDPNVEGHLLTLHTDHI